MKTRIVIPWFLMLLFIFNGTKAELSKTEKKIASSVDMHSEAAKKLLKELVNINSGTYNFEGVRKVGAVLRKELDVLGFETKWIPGDSFKRAGHLIAIHKTKKGKKILMIGHLDTVFEEDSPFQGVEMLNDSIMHGPGAADMKGGDVIIILALQALKEAGLLADMNLQIVFTGDEESSGRPLELSKKELIEAAKWADVALGYEDGDGLSTKAVVARRGSCDWTLKVSGKAAHSSQIFTDNVGSGAIYEASRIIHEFYTNLSKEENLTFSPGIIIGGNAISFDSLKQQGTAFGKNNIVAQEVLVKGDLRAVSTDQLIRARKLMKQICLNNYPGTSAELDFGDGGYPPMTATEGNYILLKKYSKVSEDLGYGPQTQVNPRDAGAADICFANDLVQMALDGIGLPGADGHTIHETANINFLGREAKRSAVLLYRLCTSVED
jgi:glutamate carboxypeptidase